MYSNFSPLVGLTKDQRECCFCEQDIGGGGCRGLGVFIIILKLSSMNGDGFASLRHLDVEHIYPCKFATTETFESGLTGFDLAMGSIISIAEMAETVPGE